MHTQTEKEYLLRAIDAFERKVIVISPDYEILAANRIAQETFPMEIVGKVCYDNLYELPTPCPGCPLQEVLQKETPVLMKGLGCSLDPAGEPCRYFSPMYSETGEIDAVVMVDFGVPILEGLEEKLMRSNEFLRNLILSSVDGVIAADKKGNILIFNDAAVEISGYSVDEAINDLNIVDVYPDGEKTAREIMKMLRSREYGGVGKLKSYKVNVSRKDGTIIPISLNAAIIYEGKEEVATLGFFHDLRESIKMRTKLEKTQLQLLQSEKMASLGKLAAGVAHQLNNPLGGITLFAKLVLEEYELQEEVREDIGRILKDAQRCRDTVKELLEFARQTRYNIQPHDINRALSRTLFLLENQALFQNIEIVKELDETLPQVSVDIQQIGHLFMNIILNAAQAMEGKGRLTLRTRKNPEKEGAIIEIEDTGPGIPGDILSHIFDPFFTTKEEGKGTGLGLSLAYGIVKKHGGAIHAKSEAGKGTIFIIELQFTPKLDEISNEGDQYAV